MPFDPNVTPIQDILARYMQTPEYGNFRGPQHPTLIGLSAIDMEMTKLEELLRQSGYNSNPNLNLADPGLVAQRDQLVQLRNQYLTQAQEQGLRDSGLMQAGKEFYTTGQDILDPGRGFGVELGDPSKKRLEQRFGIPQDFEDPEVVQKPLLPGESSAPRVAGAMGAYGLFAHATAPAALEGEALAASGKLGQFLSKPVISKAAGQIFQEAFFVPSTLATSDSIEEAAVLTAAGIGLGTLVTGLQSPKLTEQVIENAITGKPITSFDAPKEMTDKVLAELDVRPENLEAMQILNNTVPMNQWSPVLAEQVADPNIKTLETFGQNIRLKGMTPLDVALKEGDDMVAEVYTADGPISSEAVVRDAFNKMALDMDLEASHISILDQIRPSATLGERKYILLNGDREAYMTVADRLKIPKNVQQKTIESTFEMSVKDKGRILFNNILQWADIARLKGDVDVFQVPRKSNKMEKFALTQAMMEEAHSFKSLDEADPGVFSRVLSSNIPDKTLFDINLSNIPDETLLDRNLTKYVSEATEVPTRPELEIVRRAGHETILGNLLDMNRAEALGDMAKSLGFTQEAKAYKKQTLINKSLADQNLASLVFGRNASNVKMRMLFDEAKADIGNIPMPQVIKDAWNASNIEAIARDGKMQGLAWHFGRLDKVNTADGSIKAVNAILANINDVSKPQQFKTLLGHELGHAFERRLRAMAVKDPQIKEFLMNFEMAAELHHGRRWDPVAKGISAIAGDKWPEDLAMRGKRPPGYSPEHDEALNEKFADIVFLLTTKEGRESINPASRKWLAKNGINIAEEFKPGYVMTPAEKLHWDNYGTKVGKGGIPAQYDTTRNAGKVMTTPTQEAKIKFSAMTAAVNPDNGSLNKDAQEVLANAGPVASMGFEQLLEGAGNFSKNNVMKNLKPSGAAKKNSLWDYWRAILTARSAGLLTGPATHLANLLSDIWKMVEQPGITAGAATVDLAKYITGVQKDRKVFFGEVLAQLHGQASELASVFGMHQALPANLRQFAHDIRHSKDFATEILDPVTGQPINAIGVLAKGVENPAFKKALSVTARGADLVFMPLRSVDTFFFDTNFTGSIYKQAYAKAVKDGKGFTAALRDVVENVNKYGAEAKQIQDQAYREAEKSISPDFSGDLHQEIEKIAKQYRMENIPVDIEEAKIAAERSIFVAREGKRLDGILDLMDKAEALAPGSMSLALPFRRTPAYVVREGLRSSPIGAMTLLAESLGKNAAVDLGSREASIRLGQAAFGTLSFYVLWNYVNKGLIKGDPVGYDPNKSHRDTYQAAGAKPGSLHITMAGKTWQVPLERINPLGGTLQTMIGYKAAVDQAQAKGEPLDAVHEIGVNLAWNLAKNLGVGDFSRNLGDMFEAIASDEKLSASDTFKRFTNNIGASFVPTAVKQAVRSGELEQFGMKPGLKADDESPYFIGGVKASLGLEGRKKIGLFGYQQESNIGEALTSIGEQKNDPIVNKMIEVGAYHEAPKISEEVKNLSVKEQVAFQVGKGKLQRQYVERIILNPGFANLAPEAQKRLIDKAFANASELANKRAKALVKLKGTINENNIFKGRI